MSKQLKQLFQSTHLIRGATAVHGGPHDLIKISIHAPHSRCDWAKTGQPGGSIQISIHAPHSRCDAMPECTAMLRYHFNPRTSFEVRLRHFSVMVCNKIFQSTHLIRGATEKSIGEGANKKFQSTHLIRGATFLI